MHDEHDSSAYDMGGSSGASDTGYGAAGPAGEAAAEPDLTGGTRATERVRRAAAQAQDTAAQLGDVIRARPLVSAAVAVGLGYLMGRRR